jgi:hypothetical protein
VIPEIEHTTTAAFGFNAPASRAPQALLVGVPPEPTGVLAADDLAAIVLEARRLTRVRMVQPTDLERVAPFAPTMVFPASLPAGVELGRT